MRKIIAFWNNPTVKEAMMIQVENHRQADQIVKGQYWENGKGCAVGCMVHSSSHKTVEAVIGLPYDCVQLMDFIFERLPNHEAKLFPGQVLDAMRPGADLTHVSDRFIITLLADPKHGTRQYCHKREVELTNNAIDLYQRRCNGYESSQNVWLDEEIALTRDIDYILANVILLNTSACLALRTVWEATSKTRSAAVAVATAAAKVSHRNYPYGSDWHRDVFLKLLREAA